jgi:hypothetical protein
MYFGLFDLVHTDNMLLAEAAKKGVTSFQKLLSSNLFFFFFFFIIIIIIIIIIFIIIFFFFFFFFYYSAATYLRFWLAQLLSSIYLCSVLHSSSCVHSRSMYFPKRHLPNVVLVFQLVF